MSGKPRQPLSVHVRLVHHDLQLPSGRVAGVAVAGWGVPLVVINGFSAEGILYAQTTSRLVSMGFKVVAIDTPGHGRSSPLPRAFGGIRTASEFIGEALDELGVGPCLVLGHSTGGRIAADLAVDRPKQIAGVILVDAILGRVWDERIHSMATVPFYGAKVMVETGVDFVRTTLAQPDFRQLGVLARSLTRSGLQQASRPWRLLAPGAAIMTAPPSQDTVVHLRRLGIPTVVIHGDKDGLVPHEVGKATADDCGGSFVTVQGGGHLWLLQDPEVLPSIIGGLLAGELGDAYAEVIRRLGLDPSTVTTDEIEETAHPRGTMIRKLTPPVRWERGGPRKAPRLSWELADV